MGLLKENPPEQIQRSMQESKNTELDKTHPLEIPFCIFGGLSTTAA